MALVDFSLASSNELQRAKGGLKLDTDTGHVMDAAGATIGRMSIVDDTKASDRNALLSQYAAQYALSCSAYAASTAQHGFNSIGADAKFHQARERADAILASASQPDGPCHLLDLGTGDVHIPSALPNVAMGYRNEPPMADMYAPPVLVPKPQDYYFAFDKNDAFQRAYPNGGTGGGSVPEIAPRLASTLFTSTERAMGGFVATQLESAADAPLRILQATTKRIMNAILLERELRVQSLARTTTNWNTNNTVTLGAGFNWNGGASADPLKDLQARIEASVMEPTGILLALPVWHALVRNPAFTRFFSFKDSMRAFPTPQEVSSNFGLPPIYVAKMRYVDSTGATSFVWGKDAVLFRQPEQMPPATQDDIASAYTFRWNLFGKQLPDAQQAAGGFIVRQFYNQIRGTAGGLQVVVLHQDAEVQTSAYVGGLIVGATT